MEQVANRSRRQLLKGRFKAQFEQPAIRLPWVISETVFTAGCTQCNQCIEHCETQVIKRDQYGYPYLDFTQAECTFCGECERQCQQPLFVDTNSRKGDKAWPAIIDISEKCLAKNQIYCQSCRDVCDTRAIQFAFVDSAIPTPTLDVNDCTLCGACVSTCPQNSISIKTNTKHSTNLTTNTEELGYEPTKR